MTKLKNLLNKVLHILTNVNYKVKYDLLEGKYKRLEQKIALGLYKGRTDEIYDKEQLEKYKEDNANLRKRLKEYKREVAELNEEIKEEK